jgi:hypothetical protein
MMVAMLPSVGARRTLAGTAIAVAIARPASTARQRIVGAGRRVEMEGE